MSSPYKLPKAPNSFFILFAFLTSPSSFSPTSSSSPPFAFLFFNLRSEIETRKQNQVSRSVNPKKTLMMEKLKKRG